MGVAEDLGLKAEHMLILLWQYAWGWQWECQLLLSTSNSVKFGPCLKQDYRELCQLLKHVCDEGTFNALNVCVL